MTSAGAMYIIQRLIMWKVLFSSFTVQNMCLIDLNYHNLPEQRIQPVRKKTERDPSET